MGKKIAILLVALGAGALLVLLLRSGAPGAAAPVGLDDAPLADRGGLAAIPGDDGESLGDLQMLAAARSALASTTSTEDSAGAEARGAAPPLAQLTVRAVSKVDRAPLPRVRVYLSSTAPDATPRPSRHVEGSKGSLDESPLTGEDGRVELEVPAQVDCSVWARGEDGRSGQASLDVAALREGEQREVTIELAVGDDLPLVGRVVASTDSLPIEGARVGLVRSGAAFVSEVDALVGREELAAVTTGADGLFELQIPSWKTPHLRIEAAGFGLAIVVPTPGHETAEKALEIRLARSATLEARVLDGSGAPLHGATIQLSTSGYLLDRTGEGGFFGGWTPLPVPAWSGRTDPDGRAILEGLPPEVAFDVDVRRGSERLRHENSGLTLAPGEVREVEWRIGGGCVLAGLVIDQHARPVGDLEIWLTKLVHPAPRYFQPHDQQGLAARTRTDAEGRFVLTDLAAGGWWIGPAATFEPSGEPRADGVAAYAVVLDIPDGATSQGLTLRVRRGLFIRGRVLDPRGDPVRRGSVAGSPGGPGWATSADVKEDGTFVLGPLVEGALTLEAECHGAHAPSDPTTARAGDVDVVLRLKPGGGLRGRVVDAASGEGCAAEMMLTRETDRSAAFEPTTGWGSKEDGTFRLDGLATGRYGLSARTRDGRFGVLAGFEVTVGSEPAEIVIPASPGGKLALRYEGARKDVWVSISRAGVPVGFTEQVEAGTAITRAAPAGALVVRWWTDLEGVPKEKLVDLAPGETREIEVEDGG